MPTTVWKDRPVLGEATHKTGFDAHYVYQSAWATACLRRLQPTEHVDVGSDLRWLALEQAYRSILFVDIRPPDLHLPGLSCVQGSIVSLPFPDNSVSSLSSLHVLEHIGLGRYGDPVDPEGNVKAANELQRVLAPGGYLLLSTPVGQPVICFDAHRIHAPKEVLRLFSTLQLQEFSLVTDQKKFLPQASLEEAAQQRYGCGLFLFRKPAAHPLAP